MQILFSAGHTLCLQPRRSSKVCPVRLARLRAKGARLINANFYAQQATQTNIAGHSERSA